MTQKLPFKEPGRAHKRRNNTGRLTFHFVLFALLGVMLLSLGAYGRVKLHGIYDQQLLSRRSDSLITDSTNLVKTTAEALAGTNNSLRTKISFIFAIHVLRKFRCNDHFIFAFYSNRSCLACCDDCLIVIYRNSDSHCKREFCPAQSHGCTTSKSAEIAIIVCQHFKHFACCDISAYRSLCHMSGNVQSDCCRCLDGFFTRSIHVHGTSTLTRSVCLCLIICFF